VLAAGAAESHLQGGEVAFAVFVHALGEDALYVAQELVDRGFLLQELDDGTVLARVGLVFGVAARIGERAAVEDKSAAVAAGILGEALFVAETENGDGEGE
jgi:hypothetical protein